MFDAECKINDDIDVISESLKAGNPVILSTDTVIGIASLPIKSAVEEIFRLKKRPYNMNLPWFIDMANLEKYACNIKSVAISLIRTFWPGGITFVLEATPEAIKTGLAAYDGSIAFRSPNDEFILKLMNKLNTPLICTSANIHGEPPICEGSKLNPAFKHLKKHISTDKKIASDEDKNPMASTIVDVRCHPPKILRKGAITSYEIDAVLNAKC